ncbi:MerR family transcriptional regulator [Desulfatibacillum aliphaticivorans]|uniref:MerR family transcriptional regulator n=1 Tax=Desulfatibacillum aliphaticivorans TaxID=218208 RepID=UPI0004276FC5|nr:MerR family transcriptional regulator [Desulfatibacillum aliphaticivorans]
MADSHDKKWFRIAELERQSGVSRRTIHFYLQEGLLHAPMKTGKTMAYYDEAHLERLKIICAAKKQGMPLFAIREKISAMKGAPDLPARNKGIGGAGARKTAKKKPKSAQGNKTREAILDLACSIFRSEGYKGAKVSDITKRLNVGKGTFYFYFSDKKELFLECVPRIFAELFSDGWDEIGRERDPMVRLQLRAKAVLPVLKEFCAILALCKEAVEDPDPKLKDLGNRVFTSIRKPIETDLIKGMKMGLFRDVDAKLTSAIIVGIAEGLQYLQSCEEGFGMASAQQSLLDFFRYGVAGDAR